MKMRTSLILLALIVLPPRAIAGNGSWHGYLSQGITQSVKSNFLTDNEAVTGELTELGLNGRYEFNQNLAVVGQVVYLDGGNRYEQGTRIDYLFMDWTLPDFGEWKGHFHLGRFKNRHWLYSATRDVPHTRTTSVLPQSVYYDGFRDIAVGSDGALLQFTRLTEHGHWEVNWSYGRSSISGEQTQAFLGVDAQGRAKQDYVHQFSLFWQPPSMNWRVGGSLLESDFRYVPALNDTLISGTTNIRRLMLSLEYFSKNWEFSAEFLREYQQDSGAYGPDYYNSRIGEGGFVQLRYMFTPQVSGLVMQDIYDLNREDREGTMLEASTGGVIPAYFGYMDTTTIGLRWDIAPSWRLQGEYHWVQGGARIRGLLNPQTQLQSQSHWRMWAVQLMYWF